MGKYQGIHIFKALDEIEAIKESLRKEYPSFKFVGEKGDIGEAFAIQTYNLKQAPSGQSGFDALTQNGKKVSIKLLWEINVYRGLHLSGGSNTTKNAYKEADYLLVLGRDETNKKISTLYNGPLEMLMPYLRGDSVHPRIEVRTLKKIYPFVPENKKLKAFSEPLPDGIPIYYPKDLHDLFGIEKNYWSKFSMLWRNHKCRHYEGVNLNHFLDYGIGKFDGIPLLSFKDINFLKNCYKFFLKGYDHHTSAFAAFSKINNLFFPELVKITYKNLVDLNISYSVVQAYQRDKDIKKYFSKFFSMENKGPGGRILQRYLTSHDIRILKRAYKIRGKLKGNTGRGGIKDKVNYIEAGKIAAKEIGYAPKFEIPDPRCLNQSK